MTSVSIKLMNNNLTKKDYMVNKMMIFIGFIEVNKYYY